MPIYITPVSYEYYSPSDWSRQWYYLDEVDEFDGLAPWSLTSRDDWDDLLDSYEDEYAECRYGVNLVVESFMDDEYDDWGALLTPYDLTYEEARAICDGRACSVTGP